MKEAIYKTIALNLDAIRKINVTQQRFTLALNGLPDIEDNNDTFLSPEQMRSVTKRVFQKGSQFRGQSASQRRWWPQNTNNYRYRRSNQTQYQYQRSNYQRNSTYPTNQKQFQSTNYPRYQYQIQRPFYQKQYQTKYPNNQQKSHPQNKSQ